MTFCYRYLTWIAFAFINRQYSRGLALFCSCNTFHQVICMWQRLVDLLVWINKTFVISRFSQLFLFAWVINSELVQRGRRYWKLKQLSISAMICYYSSCVPLIVLSGVSLLFPGRFHLTSNPAHASALRPFHDKPTRCDKNWRSVSTTIRYEFGEMLCAKRHPVYLRFLSLTLIETGLPLSEI